MTLIKRILVAGFQGFYRNKTISVASIFILVVTLSIISTLFLFQAIFRFSVTEIKSKVDISIYLRSDASDASILSIKQKLSDLTTVKDVIYVSKEDTLNNFKNDYKNDTETLAALEELGTNPFGASFSVTANDTVDYEMIMTKINEEKILGDDYNSIDKINYLDIKDSIEKLNHLIKGVQDFGMLLVFLFIAMSVMIIYNTVRLAIFTFREEISVMKLVGASNMYIRGPFIVESAIYGIVSSLISVALMYPIVNWLREKTMTFFVGFDIAQYYKDNIIEIFVILCFSGIAVSIISSMLAVRRYLKI